jgi:hypothetical protein
MSGSPGVLESRPRSVVPFHLSHGTLINDVRVNVELGPKTMGRRHTDTPCPVHRTEYDDHVLERCHFRVNVSWGDYCDIRRLLCGSTGGSVEEWKLLDENW